MRPTTVLLLLALLAIPAALRAQPVSDADVVRIALESNPTLRAALYDARRADSVVAREEARFGWILTLDGGVTRSETPQATTAGVTTSRSDTVGGGSEVGRAFEWGTAVAVRTDVSRRTSVFNPIATTSDRIEIGPTYGLGVQLTASQPLMRGAGSEIGTAPLRAALADRRASRAARDRVASEVLRDLLSAYWELWYASAALQVDQAALALARRHQGDAQARVENGTLAAVEVLSFDARVAILEETVAAAEVERTARALELGRLVGVPAQQAAALVAPPASAPEAGSDDRSADDAARSAARRSAELTQVRAALDAARVDARVADDALRPRLDLEGWLLFSGLGDRDAVAPFEEVGRGSAVSAHVGAVFELPLSTAQRHAVAQGATLGVEAAEERLRAAELRIEAEARSLAARAEAARRRVGLAIRSVEASRRLAEAERERFALGTTTSLAVQTAEDDLRAAELRVARARVDARNASLALGHLTGDLLRERG